MKINKKTQAAVKRNQLVVGTKNKVKKDGKSKDKAVKVKSRTYSRAWSAQAWRTIKEIDATANLSLCNMRASDAKTLDIVATKGDGTLRAWIVWGARGERCGVDKFTGTVAHLGNGLGVDFKSFKKFKLGDLREIASLIRKNGKHEAHINYDKRTFNGHILKTEGDFYSVFTDGKAIFNMEDASLGEKNRHMLYSLGKGASKQDDEDEGEE